MSTSNAISHWTCSKCRRSFAWVSPADKFGAVTCSHCGHEVPRKSVEADQSVINGLRDKLTRESEAEWAARTPEQEAAFNAGRAARTVYEDEGEPPLKGTRIRSGPLAANERCPYKYILKAEEQNPLRDWWHRGWTWQEFERGPRS